MNKPASNALPVLWVRRAESPLGHLRISGPKIGPSDWENKLRRIEGHRYLGPEACHSIPCTRQAIRQLYHALSEQLYFDFDWRGLFDSLPAESGNSSAGEQ